jgi:hypothetical protein
MSVGNLLVKDSCLECKHLLEHLESGVSCSCSNDYVKGTSQIEIDELVSHGRTGKLQEVRKPYRMADVDAPLKRVLVTMQNLANESAKLVSVTKAISEDVQKKSRKRKVRNAKAKAKFTVSGIEKSKAHLEQGKKQSLKKSDDIVVLGILDGSLKGCQLEGWIEKRAGVR